MTETDATNSSSSSSSRKRSACKITTESLQDAFRSSFLFQKKQRTNELSPEPELAEEEEEKSSLSLCSNHRCYLDSPTRAVVAQIRALLNLRFEVFACHFTELDTLLGMDIQDTVRTDPQLTLQRAQLLSSSSSSYYFAGGQQHSHSSHHRHHQLRACVVAGILPQSPSARAGVRTDDCLLLLAHGKHLQSDFSDIRDACYQRPLTFVVIREKQGSKTNTTATATNTSLTTASGKQITVQPTLARSDLEEGSSSEDDEDNSGQEDKHHRVTTTTTTISHTHHKNHEAVPVEQYKGTRLVATFASIREASKATRFTRKAVVQSCRGEIDDLEGYAFKYRRPTTKGTATTTTTAAPTVITSGDIPLKSKKSSSKKSSRTKHRPGANPCEAKSVEQWNKKDDNDDDDSMHIVATFQSITAAGATTGICRKAISACCKGERDEAGGFVWKFGSAAAAAPVPEKHASTMGPCKSVEQFDGRRFVASFVSMSDAEAKTGISRHHIAACCNGDKEEVGGFIWKFAYQQLESGQEQEEEEVAEETEPQVLEEEENFEEEEPEEEEEQKEAQEAPASKKGPSRPRTMPRVVQQWDGKKLLATFESLSAAAFQTKSNRHHIALCCRGEREEANGFIWKFTEGSTIKPTNNKESITRAVEKWDGSELVATYDSITSAAKANDVCMKRISDCCRGKNQQTGGFTWKYAGEDNSKKKKKKTAKTDNKSKLPEHLREVRRLASSKSVEQWDGSKLLATFDSITVAQDATGVSRHGIGKCCNGIIGTAGGFTWKFAEASKEESSSSSSEEEEEEEEQEVVVVEEEAPAPIKSINSRYGPKAVIQYKGKREIARHESIKAASKASKVNRFAVAACCKGKKEEAGGFIWKFEAEEEEGSGNMSRSSGSSSSSSSSSDNENEEKEERPARRRAAPSPAPSSSSRPLRGPKAVVQMKGRREIARFESIKAAEAQTKVNRFAIAACCKGKLKDAGGFFWQFEDPELRPKP